MGYLVPLIVPLLLISSSLSNPIPLERAAPWPEDIGILEQNAPQTTQLSASDKLSCDNSGAERCLLFPIGCVPGENCTDRLEMRRVESGTNEGDIIISLNLHVSRTAHMLVAVPMPDLTNPNSTFLIGCSIDDAIAVVARPDVDGVTEQLQLPWLRLVAVRATSDDLECIVSASPGFVDLPEGDVAVFAGDLEPEEEIRQSSRISGSLDEEREEEERKGGRSRERERVQVESSIQKISPPHFSHERTTPSLDHSESDEPILTSIEHQAEPILRLVEDQRLSTTEVPEKTTVAAISNKANKLRLKMLHSSENSSAERAHRHSSAERTHSTHAVVHHESTSTTTTTQKTTTTSTTEAPEMEESIETTETPSTQTPKQSTTTREIVKDEDKSTTVLPLHHTTHHHGESHEHHKEKTHHSHERATVDKEHHSVRMEPVTTTTSEIPTSFEDDKELSEEDKEILRKLEAGHVKEERRDGEEEEDESPSLHSDGKEHHKHATVYELTREAAQDPIGRRPSEHSHTHHSSSHDHSHSHRAEEEEDEGKEEEHTTKKPSHSHKKEEEDEGRQRMGEKKHYRRSEETEEEEDDDDDSSSSLSLIIPMIIILAPVVFD